MSVTHVVTGATGYTGRYIARRLLDLGHDVRSLTGHPDRPSPFGDRVAALPYNFDQPDTLVRSLEGVDTVFNTYWIRFARGELTHERATENLRTLFAAASAAGVRRGVHVSITNARADSPLPYFRGKALVEMALRESGLSYVILKPTVIFGREDILINNIAWLLRKFPVHPIFGSGDYRVHPIYVEDLADLAVNSGSSDDNIEMDAVGPEIYTYEDLVRLIRRSIGSSSKLVHVPNSMAMLGARLMGLFVQDVVLTRDEMEGLTSDLLVSRSGEPPLGATRLSDWLAENAHRLGTSYASELDRHYR